MPATGFLPAGLMAAERLCARGLAVDLYDAMPSLGRKFLMAGKSGLDLTHDEPFDRFLRRFGAAANDLAPALEAFPPAAIRDWAHGLGVATFVGSSTNPRRGFERRRRTWKRTRAGKRSEN